MAYNFLKKKLDLRALVSRLNQEIWKSSTFGEHTPKGILYSLLRLGTIICQGILNNKIPNQAAALSYYSLIAMGPLIAIIIMISSFVFEEENPDLAADALQNVLVFIAPPAAEYSKVEEQSYKEELQQGQTDTQKEFNPQLLQLIETFASNAKSKAVGIVGTLILIAISIQLISSIEKTFNSIWGTHSGRSWAQRIILYWTLLSLGALLGFTAVTLLSASTFARVFNQLPFGVELLKVGSALVPILSYLMVMTLLACFYRFIPNTSVRWRAAFAGAFLVVILLFLNNYFSFLYVSKVLRAKSLYGSVGIMPILLFSLFIFWLFVLLGGQLTYAIQNLSFLANQRAWEGSSKHTHEMLSWAALVLICRRFQACKPAYSSEQLSKKIKVPGQILNECLGWLCKLNWINPIELESGNSDAPICYQPACPIENMSPKKFKEAFEHFGATQGTCLVESIDPLIPYYEKNLTQYGENKEATKTMHMLFEEFPIQDSSL